MPDAGHRSRAIAPLPLMLGFVPVAIAVGVLAPQRHVAVFAVSTLAILPLAAYIGKATEALAAQLGGGIGGLLNATFGNAAELIIGILALREGLPDLVKASLTGSIIGRLRCSSALSWCFSATSLVPVRWTCWSACSSWWRLSFRC